ncbi:fibronectin type III domain-containing protein [Thecamonas trahens ATCC 50062]|uniref:Fibronectin type III domain-containing protein n=1 Tax=Thecamonas trahens ATCC 50062 TaxID=461836 RepID=A0A0L0D571_THETB|nr:fibronectin type III domain-containing protein [Thecamonas trahens ATCC 50062]KNC47522.1 fibronectin type III domain-containing protein [Thecamonas trahens ATCC 50062]|eukprot:XP_013759456.1 fibronectin type III domain-containing protein [Thecamonas trahens ATCC 50062]
MRIVVVALLLATVVCGAPDQGTYVAVNSYGLTPASVLDTVGGRVVTVSASGDNQLWLEGRSAADGSPSMAFSVCTGAGCGRNPAAVFHAAGANSGTLVAYTAADGTLALVFCEHGLATCVDRTSNLPSLAGDSGLEPSIALDAASGLVVIVTRDSASGSRLRAFRCPALGTTACSSAIVDAGAPPDSGLTPSLVLDPSGSRGLAFTRDAVVNNTLRVWTFNVSDSLAVAGSISSLNVPCGCDSLPMAEDGGTGLAADLSCVDGCGAFYSGFLPSAIVIPGSSPVRYGVMTQARGVAAGGLVRSRARVPSSAEHVLVYHVFEELSSGELGYPAGAPVFFTNPSSTNVAPPSLVALPQVDQRLVAVASVSSGGRFSLHAWRFRYDGSDMAELAINAGLGNSVEHDPHSRSVVFDPVSYNLLSAATDVLGSSLGLFVQPMEDTPEPIDAASVLAADATSVTVGWAPPTRYNVPVVRYEVQIPDHGGTMSDTSPMYVVLPGAGESGSYLASNRTSFTEYSFRVLVDPPSSVLSIGTPNDFRSTLVLSADTEFSISIRAVNSNGTAPWSEPLVVSTDTINISPPDAPPRPSASDVTSSTLRLAWIAPADNNLPITMYIVHQISPARVLNTTTTFAFIDELLPNQFYQFRIQAVNGNGTSPFSPLLDVKTATINAPPEAPGGLYLGSVATSSSLVSLRWDVSPPNAADPPFAFQILVERLASLVDTSGEAASTIVEVFPQNPNDAAQLTAVVTGLLPATTYRFSVRSRNTNGTSDYAATMVTETTLADVPEAPLPPLVAGIAWNSVNFTITAPADNGSPISRITVYRNGEFVRALEGAELAAPQPYLFVDSRLMPLSLYVYTVSASNAVGESPVSAALSVQTGAEPTIAAVTPPPPPPSNTLLVASAAGLGAILLLVAILLVILIVRRQRKRARAGPPMPDFTPFRFGKYGTTAVKPAVSQRAGLVESVLPFLFDHPTNAVLKAMLMCVDPADADDFAKSLLAVALAKGKEKEVILAACALEVERADSLGTLFRVNSVATKLMQAYSKAVGLPYMWEAVGRHVAVWYHENHAGDDEEAGEAAAPQGLSTRNMEIDTSKVGAGQAETNKYLLMAMCQQFFESIVSTGKFVPVGMRRICLYLQNAVSAKFPTVGTTPTNSYLFLRFLNPAISAPEAFGVLPNPPSREERRQLILVTKVLQNLANGVLFGTKERFMVQLNPFLNTNMPRLNDYVRDVLNINVPSFDPFPAAEEMPASVLPLSLAVLHGYLARFLTKPKFKAVLKGATPMAGYEVLPDIESSSSSSSSSYSSSNSSGDENKTAASLLPPPAPSTGTTGLLPPPPPLLASGPGAAPPPTGAGVELAALSPSAVVLDMPGGEAGGSGRVAAALASRRGSGFEEMSMVSSIGGDDTNDSAPVNHGSMLFRQFKLVVQQLGNPLTKSQLFPTKSRKK